jgi:hypothetical protein
MGHDVKVNKHLYSELLPAPFSQTPDTARVMQFYVNLFLPFKIKRQSGRRWWLSPVILAPQEAETRRVMVQSQTGQIAHETLPKKVRAHGEGPEFKFQYCKKIIIKKDENRKTASQ